MQNKISVTKSENTIQPVQSSSSHNTGFGLREGSGSWVRWGREEDQVEEQGEENEDILEYQTAQRSLDWVIIFGLEGGE